MSAPFIGRRFVLHQPDGSEIEVEGWGNQQSARFQTLDGRAVLRDPVTHEYQLVEPTLAGPAFGAASAEPVRERVVGLEAGTRRCDQRRCADASVKSPLLGPPRRSSEGEYRGLCIPIEFPDCKGTISREEVEAFCNEPGYSGFGNCGSVYDYFLDNSIGKLRYTNLVTPWYMAEKPRSYYANRFAGQPIRARELILEALRYFKAQGMDFSELSVDEKGFVYAVNVFYAGTCPNDWGEGLWPHSCSLSPVFDLGQGRLAYDYQITDMGKELKLATFCHENGHMVCDFPDLYDYDGDSIGAGAYCLMSAGGFLDPKNPAQISAYLKYKAGWAGRLRKLPKDGSELELSASGNDFLIRKKSNSKYEYFLIENRWRAGRDATLPSEGLAIWHVDEQGDRDANEMSPESHFECSLEQADGRFDLERKATSIGDSGDLFRQGHGERFAADTRPDSRWWSGSKTRFDLFEIGAPGPLMRLRARS